MSVRLVLNLLWLVLSGLWMFLANMFIGLLWCIRIIGILFGVANFELVPSRSSPWAGTSFRWAVATDSLRRVSDRRGPPTSS